MKLAYEEVWHKKCTRTCLVPSKAAAPSQGVLAETWLDDVPTRSAQRCAYPPIQSLVGLLMNGGWGILKLLRVGNLKNK
jgi:hypothetical protein